MLPHVQFKLLDMASDGVTPPHSLLTVYRDTDGTEIAHEETDRDEMVAAAILLLTHRLIELWRDEQRIDLEDAIRILRDDDDVWDFKVGTEFELVLTPTGDSLLTSEYESRRHR